MAKSDLNRLTAREQEYQMQYGALPACQEELLQYVAQNYPASKKQVDAAMARIDKLTWSTAQFVLWLVPQPTPRPRFDGHHFFVKHAAENRKIIKRYVEQNVVATRAEVFIDAYLPTPTTQLNRAEIYLAEAKIIRPIGAMDVDNLMKTYLDMMQNWLIVNDTIVTCGCLEKYYSIKPRIEITLRYQDGYDSRYNEKRITNSKWYKHNFAEPLKDLKHT